MKELEDEYRFFMHSNFRNCDISPKTNPKDLEIFFEKLQDEKYAITALFWAAATKKKHMIKVIFKVGHHMRVIPRSATGELLLPFRDAQQRWVVPWSPRMTDDELVEYVLRESTALALHLDAINKWTTVLHWALSQDNISLLRAALAYGADMEQENHLGETPMLVATLKEWRGRKCPEAVIWLKACAKWREGRQ